MKEPRCIKRRRTLPQASSGPLAFADAPPLPSRLADASAQSHHTSLLANAGAPAERLQTTGSDAPPPDVQHARRDQRKRKARPSSEGSRRSSSSSKKRKHAGLSRASTGDGAPPGSLNAPRHEAATRSRWDDNATRGMPDSREEATAPQSAAESANPPHGSSDTLKYVSASLPDQAIGVDSSGKSHTNSSQALQTCDSLPRGTSSQREPRSSHTAAGGDSSARGRPRRGDHLPASTPSAANDTPPRKVQNGVRSAQNDSRTPGIGRDNSSRKSSHRCSLKSTPELGTEGQEDNDDRDLTSEPMLLRLSTVEEKTFLEAVRFEEDASADGGKREVVVHKHWLCFADEIEDGNDEKLSEETGCKCCIPYRDDTLGGRTYKRCGCPTPTFTQSGSFGVASAPSPSKSCLKSTSSARSRRASRKKVTFVPDDVEGPSLPVRRPCDGYEFSADTNSRSHTEEDLKNDAPEGLRPRWTAISIKRGGAHGEIERRQIEVIKVGSLVDLHIEGSWYAEATVTACDVATRVITVRHDDVDRLCPWKEETLSLDSPRVWQHRTYTKHNFDDRHTRGCAENEKRKENARACEEDGEGDSNSDTSPPDRSVGYDEDEHSDCPPPRTIVTPRSWENAYHESEDEDEDESGNDADSYRSSDDEDEDQHVSSECKDAGNRNLSPPLCREDKVRSSPSSPSQDNPAVVPSPSAPPSPSSQSSSSRSQPLLSPLPSPKVKSVIFTPDSDGDDEADNSSTNAEDGDREDSDMSDEEDLLLQPLWDTPPQESSVSSRTGANEMFDA